MHLNVLESTVAIAASHSSNTSTFAASTSVIASSPLTSVIAETKTSSAFTTSTNYTERKFKNVILNAAFFETNQGLSR